MFLEAYAGAAPGDVLVIDNGGRTDEACVGDLAVLEGAAAGVAGETLREQTGFADYRARRATDPGYTFRQHLRRVGGAIEE
ncbi:hypothetical protein AB0L34_24385 [Micromonospora sp. NPDC052213]|uniref:hypothetical protein n=1 Tax=Micromonospora sp. NPDC052213 TaxID=3155812 RepID=UPI003446E981